MRLSLADRAHAFRTATAVVVCLVASVAVGRLLGQGQISLMVLLVAVPFGILMARSPHVAITTALATAVLLPSIIGWLQLPGVFAYSSHLSVLLVTAVTVFEGVRHRRLLVNGWVVGWMLCVLGAAVIASTSTAALQSVVGYLIGPLLMFAVMNARLSEKEETGLVKTLIILAAIQIPVVVIEKVIYFSGNPDRVGGTLGRAGTQFMGVFMAIAWCMLVAAIVTYRNWRLTPVLALPLLAMAAGEVKAGFVLAAFGTLFMLVVHLLARSRDSGVAVLAGFAAAPIGFILLVYEFAPWLVATYVGVGRSGKSIFTDFGAAHAYLSQYGTGGQAPRLEGLRMIASDVMSLGVGLGHGPGAMSSSSLVGGVSTSYEVTVLYGWSTSAMRYLFEIGPIGMVVFLTALGMLARLSGGLLGRSVSQYVRWLALGFSGAVAVFVVGGFYTAAWAFVGTAVPFWCLAGLVARYAAREAEPAEEPRFRGGADALC